MAIQITTVTPPGTTIIGGNDSNGTGAPQVAVGPGGLQFQDILPDGSPGAALGPGDLTVLEVQEGGILVGFPDGTVIFLAGAPQQIAGLLEQGEPAAGNPSAGGGGNEADAGGSSSPVSSFSDNGFGTGFDSQSDGSSPLLDAGTEAANGDPADPTLPLLLLGNDDQDGGANQAPVALDFLIGGEIPVGIEVSMSATDIVSEFGTDADSDLTSASLTFDSATVDGVPVASLADIGFTYAPGTGDAGGFTIDTETAPAFAGLGEGETVEVIVAYTISDGVDSDTGELSFTVTGTPGTFDVEINYLGVNVAGQVLEADAESDVGEAEAEVEYSGAQMLRDIVDGIDISQADIGDFFDDIDGDFFDAFQADGLTGAFAVASEDSTADAFATDGSLSEAAARSGSTAVAAGETGSKTTAVADDGSTSTAVAAAEACAQSTAAGDSMATTIATADSTADAAATGGSTAVAVATGTTDASASASDNSSAVATSITDSTATAEATQSSEATATAHLGSTAQATARDASKAGATAVDDSTGTAVAEDGATARAEAGDESTGTDGTSDATAMALSGSTVTAAATSTSSTAASAANQSEAMATSDSSSTAKAEATDASSAEATASDMSEAETRADGNSHATATARNESEATAAAAEDSTTSAVAEDGSEATAVAAMSAAASTFAGMTSDATSLATRSSVADAVALDDSSAAASSTMDADALAFAEDRSTAVASAENDSSGSASANASSVAAVDALHGASATASSTSDSAASASASNASTANAEAVNGSASTSTADNASDAATEATNGSVATADAFNESKAATTTEDSSSATSLAADGSQATAEASDTGTADSVADNIVGAPNSPIPLTLVPPVVGPFPSAFFVDADSGSTEPTITISGLPAGSVLSRGTPNGDGTVWTILGELPIVPADVVTLTPPENFTGSFELTAKATNGNEEAEVVLTVTVADPANVAPVAFDDDLLTDEDSPLIGASVFDVNGSLEVDDDGMPVRSGSSGKDYDPDQDDFSVSEVNGEAGDVGAEIALPSGALLTLNADGSFDYDPNGQFESLNDGESATDSFTYRIDDGAGGSDTATVTVTIDGVNDPTIEGIVGGDILLREVGDVLADSVSEAGEQVDLSEFGANNLVVSVSELLAFSARSDDLRVLGDPGDSVTLIGDFAATGGTETVGADSFAVFESIGTDARLLAEEGDIQVILVSA